MAKRDPVSTILERLRPYVSVEADMDIEHAATLAEAIQRRAALAPVATGPDVKIVVDNNLTYQTNLRVRVGSRVMLPNLPWMDRLDDHIGTVTSLDSDYAGPCKHVIKVLKY